MNPWVLAIGLALGVYSSVRGWKLWDVLVIVALMTAFGFAVQP